MEDIRLYTRIVDLKSLKPSKETNEAFSCLVKYCEENKTVNLKKMEIKKLQKLSSIAEYEMELYWAKKIIGAINPQKELQEFWYYRNYERLVDLEYSNITYVFEKSINNVLFVGGGPLPLTAILLYKKYGIKCTILERDEVSYELSLLLIQKLKLDTYIKIIKTEAQDYGKYEKFNLIYLAALVEGDDIVKIKLIKQIYRQIRSNNLILCRSSHGTRKLLYASISKVFLNKVKPILEVRPYNSVINSFFILQKN